MEATMAVCAYCGHEYQVQYRLAGLIELEHSERECNANQIEKIVAEVDDYPLRDFLVIRGTYQAENGLDEVRCEDRETGHYVAIGTLEKLEEVRRYYETHRPLASGQDTKGE